MTEDRPRPGIQLPVWKEMKVRMFITGLVIIAFVLLGLWLHTNSWLSAFTTVIVVAVSTILHATLRGQAVKPKRDKPANDEANRLVGTVRESQLLRPLTTESAGRATGALLLGAGVALAEILVQTLLFSDAQFWLSGIASLSLVLFPMYACIGIYESRQEYTRATSWTTRLHEDFTAWVSVTFHLDVRGLKPVAAAIVWAATRTLISALTRMLMMVILEPVFNSWYAIGFLGATGFTLVVVGGLRIFGEVGKHIADVAIPKTPNDDSSPER